MIDSSLRPPSHKQPTLYESHATNGAGQFSVNDPQDKGAVSARSKARIKDSESDESVEKHMQMAGRMLCDIIREWQFQQTNKQIAEPKSSDHSDHSVIKNSQKSDGGTR